MMPRASTVLKINADEVNELMDSQLIDDDDDLLDNLIDDPPLLVTAQSEQLPATEPSLESFPSLASKQQSTQEQEEQKSPVKDEAAPARTYRMNLQPVAPFHTADAS